MCGTIGEKEGGPHVSHAEQAAHNHPQPYGQISQEDTRAVIGKGWCIGWGDPAWYHASRPTSA